MTVSSTTNRKEYAGNGVTTSFSTSPVVFFASGDLTVYVVNDDGTVTTLTENTDYTVSGGGTPPATGSVSLAGGSSPYGAPSTDETLAIVRDVDIVQETDFVQNDGSDADVAEAALDRAAIISQQLDARIDRTVRLADSDVSGAALEIPTPEANSIFGWNAAATALVNYVVQAGTSLVDLAASAGASLIGYIQAGVSAIATTVQARLRRDLHFLDFVPTALHAGILARTNTTDLSPYLAIAMNAMFVSTNLDTNRTLHFSDGEYLFAAVNPFGQWSNASAQARRHVTFQGSGRYSALIKYMPGGSADAYLYDGSTGTGATADDQQLLLVLFEKLGFIFDETGMSGGTLNLARETPKSGTPNQNFQFRDCYFLGPSTVARAGIVLTVSGTINGSESHFNNCKASQMKSIISSTNSQAVNHYIFGCDWESMVGDIYKFVDGGGQLTHVGGSIIYGSTLAADAYILNIQASVGQTTNFNIYGIKTELNDTNALIANLQGVNNASQATFRDCDFGTTSGTGSRTAVSVQPNSASSVVFDRCNLLPTTGGPFLYEFKAGTSNYWLGAQYNGRIELRDCRLPTDIHDRISWGANSNGLFRIRGGISSSAWTPDTDPNIAWDCDLFNANPARSPSSYGPQLKNVWGLIYTWPDSGANTDGARTRIKLPVNSIVKAIKVHRIAFGGTATAWSLAITNDDGTYTYGVIPAGAQNVVMDFADAAVWRLLTSGVNQYIRVVTVKSLAYNTQTANYTVGATLTDTTTLTTAKILADADAGAAGTLTLGFITGGTGAFGVGNIITDGSGGSATAGATTSLQGSNIQRAMASGDIYHVEYI